MEIINEGQDYKPALDANGQPIEVQIVENKRAASSSTTSPAPESERRGLYGNNELFSREVSMDQLSDCGCIWWFT
jgi:hypothetical protein